MLSSFSTRVTLAALSLLFGMSSLIFAQTITLQASANNSIQIKALKGSEGKTTWEIQFGGGSDQPPSNTLITGKASAVIDGKTYSGYYQLSTAPHAQLRMISKTRGTRPGTEDVYTFLTDYSVLQFKFAATLAFNDPWLVVGITNVQATQQVLSQQDNGNQQNNRDQQNNGDRHPPIRLVGPMTTPTGGSLAGYFTSGDSKLTLNVGGNQRLLDLTPMNTNSGMNLDSGTLTKGDYKPGATEGVTTTNEATAAAMLKVAQQDHDVGKYDLAQKKYEEIIDRFPQTKAAGEARRLLDRIKSK